METYDAGAANSLWDLFRRYGVRQTPMLTSWSRMACLNGPPESDRAANPLSDVRNMRAVEEVIVRGKTFAGHAAQ
jgi:hypothetical protein